MSESMAVAEASMGVQVLIRHPRTTPPSSSSELSSDSGEEDECPPLVGSLRVVGTSMKKALMSG